MMTATWKSMAALGFSAYEACTDGSLRSVDRIVGERQALKGTVLKTRPSNRGYPLVNLTQDDGKRVTRTVHSLILATFDGLPPSGMVGRHLNDDPTDNRWAPGATREQRIAAGGNLMYGTPPENEADKVANGNRPAAAVKLCVRCQGPMVGNGRRCHECVVWIGVTAAELLSGGTPLGSACEQLEYPSAEGLHTLAVKYGGYGVRPPVAESWLRRVMAALRDRLDLGDDE